MKKLVALCLLFSLALPVAAVEDGQVMYVGGTISGLKEGVIGQLDTESQASLAFKSSGATLAIPYEKIESFEYYEQVARHLGVLPAIVVGLVRKRQHRHFFRITFREEMKAPQVAIFEVPKQMPHSLLAVLQARAPQGCRPQRCPVPNHGR